MSSIVTQFNKLPLLVKAVLLIGVIIGAGIAWWLFSPLFLSGTTLNQDKIENTVTIRSGELNFIDNAHWGEGTVNLVQDQNGTYYLSFENVEIANGPSLVVYLSDKTSFSGTRDDPGNYFSLGGLPANIGTFNIELPSEVNVEEFNSVLIWCDPFSVVFTWATLS